MRMLAHSVSAPFGQISLCLNCDYVSDAMGDLCPHCGLRGLMNLKKAFEVVRHQHLFDSDEGLVCGHDADTYLRCRCGELMEIQLKEGAIQ